MPLGFSHGGGLAAVRTLARGAAGGSRCAFFVALSGSSNFPGATPDPLRARLCLVLSCAVLSHVARQLSPSALAAHTTPLRGG
jgi:hypothetical protein